MHCFSRRTASECQCCPPRNAMPKAFSERMHGASSTGRPPVCPHWTARCWPFEPSRTCQACFCGRTHGFFGQGTWLQREDTCGMDSRNCGVPWCKQEPCKAQVLSHACHGRFYLLHEKALLLKKIHVSLVLERV